MMYKALVVLHLLGASVWIGGHAALVSAVLPRAMRERKPERIIEFERGYGRLGLAALALQFVTGVWLATYWISDWGAVLREPTPAGTGVALKLALLTATVVLAGHAHHSLLSRLTPERLRGFAVHAWIVTGLAVLMLVVGASIRLGGF
jgi:putative copper export protein